MNKDNAEYSKIIIRRLHRLGLLESPFAPYVDGRYFFPLIEQKIAYQEILLTIAQKPLKNINIVIGDRQLGKSSIARRVATYANANPEQKARGFLFEGNDDLIPSRVVKAISAELGMPQYKDNDERLRALENTLRENMLKNGESIFIAVDGDVRPDTMKTLLDMASWFCDIPDVTSPKAVSQSLVQIALFGSMTGSYYAENQVDNLYLWTNKVRVLGVPSIQELSRLLEMQVKAVGHDAPLFTPGSMDMLVEESGQIPGVLMGLANQCLHYLVEINETVITEQVINDTLILLAEAKPDTTKIDEAVLQ